MEVMNDCYGAPHLYRRIISPSVKFRNEKCQKETHCRHTNYPYQPQVSHLKAASPVHSVVSAPGHLEASRLSLEPISEDTLTHENGTVSTNSEYVGYRFHPTVRFKTASLPAMPLSRKYSPSPNGTTRSVPISYRHPMVTPSRFWENENPKVLYGKQRDRLKYEEQAKEQCRRLKRTSEILKHRIDKQYYMAGSKIPLQGRYDVDNTDLLRLKLLSQNKQLAGYKTAKDMSNNHRESPSGQLSTPVPGGRRGKTSSDALSSGTERENHSLDGKWAEEASDASSVNEYDSFITEGRLQEFTARKALVLAEGKSRQQDQGGASSEELSRTARGEPGDEKTDGIKSKEKASTRGAKKGKIRFQEDEKAGGKKEKGRKDLTKKSPNGQENEENPSETGEPKEEKRNKYLDEWLGIKREVQDTRYKPGKPPPNRIFISASPENNKKTAKKFSSTFLTEITEGNPLEDESDVTPDAKYGIINNRQRHAFGLLFDEVDKDKNGSVTLEELKLRMQPSVSKHDIHHFVQVFDLNKDKTVDKREFTAICALNDRLAGVTTESEHASLALDLENLAHHIVIFKEMFKTVDEDDDNRLDAGELLEMVSAAMETEIGADLQLAKEVLERSRDEFGFIDFVGFLSYIPFFAKLLKTILEHPLTIDELERARERVKQQQLTFKPKKQAKEPKSWEVF